MITKTYPNKLHQPESYWLKVIEGYTSLCKHTKQSGAQYCRDNAISYPSFMRWKYILAPKAIKKVIPVLDLDQLKQGELDLEDTSPLNLTVKLGNGVELRFTQQAA